MLDSQVLQLPVEAHCPQPLSAPEGFCPAAAGGTGGFHPQPRDSSAPHRPPDASGLGTGGRGAPPPGGKAGGLQTVPCLCRRAEDEDSALLALIEKHPAAGFTLL